MSELRQKFEELPDIKGIIYGSDFGFNESLNQYYHPDHTNHRLNYAFIMGAWCAFQSQQAQIDELKHQKSLQELAINQISQANQEWQRINSDLQKRVDEVCDLLDRAEVNHKHLLTKYQSTKAMEMSSSKMLSRVDQILNALNESMKDFKEMDLYDKGYRVAVGYVIADLEKALRGENDQSN